MTDTSERLISESPVIVRRRVLWGECDPAGVVYTPRFADYFLSARDWFLRVGLGLLDRPHPDRGGLSFPMRALSFDFQSFLAADDIFDMRVRVAARSGRSFGVAVGATHEDGRAAFAATGTVVCFDRDLRAAIALPPAIVGALERYREAQGAIT